MRAHLLPQEVPDLGARSDRPRLNPTLDLTTLKLSTTEAFVLSRIDGGSTYEDICRLSGIDPQATIVILRRLKKDGIIVVGDLLTKAKVAQVTGSPKAGGGPSMLERLDDKTAVSPEELVTGPDMADEMKRRIIRLHRRMKELGLHAILGVPPDADRVTIRKAYYAASKDVHPDRYYGREIGVFKERLGEIFGRLTELFQASDKNKS